MGLVFSFGREAGLVFGYDFDASSILHSTLFATWCFGIPPLNLRCMGVFSACVKLVSYLVTILLRVFPALNLHIISGVSVILYP